jgi:glycosyltransferase involved in cell wall biosynthesis
MEQPQPLASVVIPACNHEAHIEAALASVCDQDYGNIELIVVDDASRDRTARIAREYLERADVKSRFRRLVFLENSQRLGAHRTASRGIQEARGDYINLLPSTDLFAPTRLSTLVRACGERGAEVAFSRVKLLASDSVVSSADLEYLMSLQTSIDSFPTVGFALLRSQCALSSGNLFFSRRVYERVGDAGNLEHCDGWDFVLRSVLVTEPLFVPEPLYVCSLENRDRIRRWQSLAEPEADAILKNYYFLCRNRPVSNPIAPSPAWGPFFDAFWEASSYEHLARP